MFCVTTFWLLRLRNYTDNYRTQKYTGYSSLWERYNIPNTFRNSMYYTLFHNGKVKTYIPRVASKHVYTFNCIKQTNTNMYDETNRFLRHFSGSRFRPYKVYLHTLNTTLHTHTKKTGDWFINILFLFLYQNSVAI